LRRRFRGGVLQIFGVDRHVAILFVLESFDQSGARDHFIVRRAQRSLADRRDGFLEFGLGTATGRGSEYRTRLFSSWLIRFNLGLHTIELLQFHTFLPRCAKQAHWNGDESKRNVSAPD